MRDLEGCPHRVEAGPATATCRLIGDLTGLDDPNAGRVGRDACSACCRGPVPTAARINPVIASLLSKAATDVAAQGGRPGCPAEKAADLLRWAEKNLELAFRDDDPLPSLPPRSYQHCGYLGNPEPGADLVELRFACRHPDHMTTTLDACHRCRDWDVQPRPRPRALDRLLPLPPERCGPPVRRWAVGVTTAPRKPPVLDWSLDSLIRAGWPEPRLFADRTVPIARRSAHLAVTLRDDRVGAWPNFYLGLIELLMRDPDADAYMMVEDDVLYYDRQDLRAYLEAVLWPGAEPCLVSLYCSAAYTRPEAGWYRHEGKWTMGALAFVFPAALAKRFVADARVLEHRWNGPAGGLAGVSGAVGSWAFRRGVPVYFPSPSLAQHIGDRSTIWPSSQARGRRRADQFLADLDA